MENSDQRFVVGGLVSPVMSLGRLNTKIKSDLCRIKRLLQFLYLRWEYSLTLVYYNKCQYIDNMINYTDKTVKTNIRLRGDLHFAFSRTVLRELDQPIAWEPQDAVGRCQQRPILRTRTARVRYGYPGCARAARGSRNGTPAIHASRALIDSQAIAKCCCPASAILLGSPNTNSRAAFHTRHACHALHAYNALLE